MKAIGPKLVIATHNAGKLKEIQELLAPHGIKCVSAAELGLPEPEEIGNSFVDNADLKAREAAETHGWSEPRTVGSAVASDAFFPFADGLLAAAEAGATAVIQPGGSIRDDEVIPAADEAGLAMVFTGMRHFRH